MGLEDLYREIIIDHYRSPRNRGELGEPATRTEGFNPLCGDEVVVFLDIDEGGVVTDVKIGGQGCSISMASASMMSAAVKGKTIDEVQQLTSSFKSMMSIHEREIGGDGSESEADSIVDAEFPMGDLEAMRGVVKFPVRIKCATLGWNTLLQGIDEHPAVS